jgi:hypothetical protein
MPDQDLVTVRTPDGREIKLTRAFAEQFPALAAQLNPQARPAPTLSPAFQQTFPNLAAAPGQRPAPSTNDLVTVRTPDGREIKLTREFASTFDFSAPRVSIGDPTVTSNGPQVAIGDPTVTSNGPQVAIGDPTVTSMNGPHNNFGLKPTTTINAANGPHNNFGLKTDYLRVGPPPGETYVHMTPTGPRVAGEAGTTRDLSAGAESREKKRLLDEYQRTRGTPAGDGPHNNFGLQTKLVASADTKQNNFGLKEALVNAKKKDR